MKNVKTKNLQKYKELKSSKQNRRSVLHLNDKWEELNEICRLQVLQWKYVQTL